MPALFDHLSALYEAGHKAPVSGLLSDEDLSDGRSTPAAVLIAVVERDEPAVILTQRPTNMRDHPGQVAFPGGKIDPGEDAITAALREAEEELALPRETVRVIGASDDYHTGTGFLVTPVLGVVPAGIPLTPNPLEVEAWFEVPLATLLDTANWTQRSTYWQGHDRHYLDMQYDGFRIWGVTAAICANLARRIDVAQLHD